MSELHEFLVNNGFPTHYALDGQFHRFDRSGTLSGWLTGQHYTVNGRTVAVVRCGDWRDGTKLSWRTEGNYAPGEEAEIAAHIRTADEAARKAKEILHGETSLKCIEAWGNSIQQGTTPYLTRKKVGLHGARIDSENPATLLVPLRDVAGKLWNLQRIFADGSKYFTAGGKIKGCFALVSGSLGKMGPGAGGENVPLHAEGPIYVAEGFATAASISDALGPDVCVVSAFNAGNLPPVCGELRRAYPSAEIIVAGDDDRHTTKVVSGRTVLWNPGREKAEEAAALSGGRAIFPTFADPASRSSDFNDLLVDEGIEEVRRQITDTERWSPCVSGAGPVAGEEWDPESVIPNMTFEGRMTEGPGAPVPAPLRARELRAIQPPVKKDGKPGKISEKMVVDRLLEFYGDDILQQEGDVFVYVENHWKHQDHAGMNFIYRQLQHLYANTASNSMLEGCMKLFAKNLPSAPVDMFIPRSTCANFLDGTLHAVRDAVTYKFTLEFKEHNRRDFITSVIPLEYAAAMPGTGARTNVEFEQMLVRVFQGDPDTTEKIRAVRQMYGACLMPLYPHLFLLHGPAGSGKSSLIIPAARLVHQDNWCSVEPHEFRGFLMETMLGKQVNIVTDIRVNEAIDDANIKKIEDRVPVRIDRKFQRALHAPLPAVHIFGANDLPRTLDGASGAHARRWTFLKLEKYKAVEGEYRKDYANWVFDQCPEGVLAFAIEGLRDLIESNGFFVNPASGKERMGEWLRSSDVVAQFLDDIANGEGDQKSKVILAENAQINRSVLYGFFTSWGQEAGVRGALPSRPAMFAALRSKGFKEKKIHGVRYFVGIGDDGPGTGVQVGAGAGH